MFEVCIQKHFLLGKQSYFQLLFMKLRFLDFGGRLAKFDPIIVHNTSGGPELAVHIGCLYKVRVISIQIYECLRWWS